MNPILIGSLPRVLGVIGATLLIASSAMLGAYYGFTIGAHYHVALGVVFAAAALGGEILKPLAVVGAADAIKARDFGRFVAAALLAATCIAYSLASELSLAAGTRGDAAAARSAEIDARQAAHDRRARAVAEMAVLPVARPVDELNALAKRLRAAPGANGCTKEPDGPISRRICGQVADLEAEAARSTRRQKLEVAIAEADATLATGANAVGAEDPLAFVLSAYARALGFGASPDTLAPWLALIPVLFFEIGSAFALMAVRGSAMPMPDKPEPNEATPPPPAADVPPPADGHAAGATVIELLKAKGGELKGGQRGIAKALGLSKSRANELLHQLARAGRICLETSAQGTCVRLASG